MKTTWSWWGRHETGSYWGPHEIAFANVTIFAASLPRVYCACATCKGDVTTLGSRPSRPHRVPGQIAEPLRLFWACSKQTPWLGDHWRPWRPQHDVWRFYHVSTTFLPRLWRPWRALDPFSVAVDAAYSHQRRAFFLLRKFCCGYMKTPYI